MKRIAFVVQRCGEEIVGGAEALCLALAQELDRDPDLAITILTTCARDYTTWANVYPEGHVRLRGVHAIRFEVDRPRDRARFDRLSREVIAGADLATEERWMEAQGPSSGSLRRYVERYRTYYDAFVFFGYLYASTYAILPLVEERAILVPLAHDEWPIRLRLWDAFFERPAAFVYNTVEEREFVERRFPEADVGGPIAGIGIGAPAGVSAERFRREYDVTAPFALYHGRIDESKGCAELVRSFTIARERLGSALELVMIGDVKMRIRPQPHVRVLGALDEASKWDALAACDLTVTLSPFESLSIALLEGWASEKPAIVSSRAATLVGQCRRAQAGVWVANDDELVAALALLDTETRAALGLQGRMFVERNYRWPRVVRTYGLALASVLHRAAFR